jgi:transcriptional regulator with XRE-family HTH domain
VTPATESIGDAIARAIREACERAGWSQRELARRLMTNQSAVKRLLAQGTASLDTGLATEAMRQLRLRLTIDAGGPGLAYRPRQRDRVHAWCVAYTVRRLRQLGFEVRTEVEIGDGRSRGWIDVLAYRPSDRVILCVEIKTMIDDLGHILRKLGWNARQSWAAAIGVGWRPATIVPILLVLGTVESDVRLGSAADLVHSHLPATASDLLRILVQVGHEPIQGGLALIDPRRRGREWLFRPRIHGGRSRMPYRDYADAADGVAAGRQNGR